MTKLSKTELHAVIVNLTEQKNSMNVNVARNVSELSQLELNALITDLVENKDNAYAERNKCVALIARMAIKLDLVVGLARHHEEDKDWEDDWRNIVFIELPSGQVSWHIHDSDLPMFKSLLPYEGKWDGHTTELKYERVLNPGL